MEEKSELIKVIRNEKGERFVDCKELYLGLGLNKSQWSRWYKKNIVEDDLFKEGSDYSTFDIMSNGNQTVNFSISVDTAKHISMMTRTEKGSEYRKYFIDVEKAYWNRVKNDTEKDNALLKIITSDDEADRAVALGRYIKMRDDENKELKVIKSKYNNLLNDDGLFDMNNTAKAISGEGIKIGRNKLFDKLRNMKVLRLNNEPYQSYIDRGYFETKLVDTNIGHKSKTYCTPKGLDWVIDKLKESA